MQKSDQKAKNQKDTFKRSLKIAAFSAILAFSMNSGSYASQTAATQKPDNIFGVATHILHHSEFYKDKPDYWRVDNVLPFIDDLGTDWVRTGIYALGSKSHGPLVAQASESKALKETVARKRALLHSYFDQYDKSGKHVVLAVLGHVPNNARMKEINAGFQELIVDLVQKHPSITAIELHNEPNLKFFWRATPEEYVKVYRPIAEAVKKVRPDIEILGGSLATMFFNQKFYTGALNAGLLDFVDGISVHPYNGNYAPEIDSIFKTKQAVGPNHYENSITRFWEITQKYNKKKKPLKLYFTELGYSSTAVGVMAGGDSEKKQAAYLSRLMMTYQDLKAKGIPIEAVFWYDLKNDGTDKKSKEANYGLVNFDLKGVKPAFKAYQKIIKSFPNSDDLSIRTDVEVKSVKFGGAVKTKTWLDKSDNDTIIPFWRMDQETKIIAKDFLGDLTVKMPDAKDIQRVTFKAACGSDQRLPYTIKDNTISLTNVPIRMCASWLILSK